MKIEEIPILKNKVLEMLPVTQAEVWKTLGIGSRNGSKLISIMLDEGLVKRTKSDHTYLLEGTEEKKEVKKDDKPKFHVLLSIDNKSFSPCCGCNMDCIPAKCKSLDEWIRD